MPASHQPDFNTKDTMHKTNKKDKHLLELYTTSGLKNSLATKSKQKTKTQIAHTKTGPGEAKQQP